MGSETTIHKGVRTTLTTAIRDKIVAAVTAGSPQKTAAAYARVPYSTFNDWMRRGREDPEGPYGEFAMDIDQAVATLEVRNLTIVQTAAQATKDSRGQWQAAAWTLERLYPERYALRDAPVHRPRLDKLDAADPGADMTEDDALRELEAGARDLEEVRRKRQHLSIVPTAPKEPNAGAAPVTAAGK
jgi:hypothetical protein